MTLRMKRVSLILGIAINNLPLRLSESDDIGIPSKMGELRHIFKRNCATLTTLDPNVISN